VQVNTQLADNLQKLMEQFRTLTSKHFQELKPIGDALIEIKRSEGKDKEFVRNLKTLSSAVIAVRKEPRNSASVRNLTVPPYDLFLPFKSNSTGRNDSAVFDDAAIKTFNEAIQQLNEHWAPFAVAQETREPNLSNPDLRLLRVRILAQFEKCNDLSEFDLFKPTLKAHTDLFERKIATAVTRHDEFRTFITSLCQVFCEGLPNEVQKWQTGQALPLDLNQRTLDVIKGKAFSQIRRLRNKINHDDPDARLELAPIYQSLIGERGISSDDSERWLALQIAILENLASALEQLSRTLESVGTHRN
jgi:hypothetical protein